MSGWVTVKVDKCFPQFVLLNTTKLSNDLHTFLCHAFYFPTLDCQVQIVVCTSVSLMTLVTCF